MRMKKVAINNENKGGTGKRKQANEAGGNK